jgi:hypothetical protein
MDVLTKVSLVAVTVIGVGIYSFFGKESQSVENGSSMAENSYISHTETTNGGKSQVALISSKQIQSAKQHETLSPKEKVYRQQYEGFVSAKTKSLRQRTYYEKLHEQRVSQQKAIMLRYKAQQQAIAMNMTNMQRVHKNTLQMNQLKYKRLNEQNIQRNILQNKQLNEKS